MRMTLCALVALFVSGLIGGGADAFYYGPPCPPVGYWASETKVVTTYRSQWTEQKVPCVVQNVSYRQEVTKVNVQVPVPRFYDETVRTSYYVPIPKVMERDVTTCVMVPVPVFDPCSCCSYMTFQPTTVTQRVKYTVCEYKLESRDYVVKKCRMELENRVVDQVRQIPVVTPETVWISRYSCVLVPFQTTVCVPVWVPCCAAPCCR